MSIFRLNAIATNPKREELSTPPIEVLVDSGSELTWLPGEALLAIGITTRRKRLFQTADRKTIEREVGYAIVSVEQYQTVDEVVFALPGDFSLLGVRTLEGFGVMVDALGRRLVATTTIAASGLPPGPAHAR